MMVCNTVSASLASFANSLSWSPWDAEVELVTVVISCAIRVQLTFLTGIDSWSPWDAEVELVTVVISCTIRVQLTLKNIIRINSSNTEFELIAMLTCRT